MKDHDHKIGRTPTHDIREHWTAVSTLSMVIQFTILIPLLKKMKTCIKDIMSSSSSSCHAAGTDIPDPLSPLFVHRLNQVFKLHPVSSHSCCMYVRAGRPDFARPYMGVHRSTSLMSLSQLFQQCPACLVRLTWIVFVMGGGCSYSWCFVGCCRQDLFNIALNILV